MTHKCGGVGDALKPPNSQLDFTYLAVHSPCFLTHRTQIVRNSTFNPKKMATPTKNGGYDIYHEKSLQPPTWNWYFVCFGVKYVKLIRFFTPWTNSSPALIPSPKPTQEVASACNVDSWVPPGRRLGGVFQGSNIPTLNGDPWCGISTTKQYIRKFGMLISLASKHSAWGNQETREIWSCILFANQTRHDHWLAFS